MTTRSRPRFFNTTGPCNPERHFMLPPEERLQDGQLDRYLEDELYWVLHAPRQTGKTTFLQSWMREINAKGEAVACYVTVERCQGLDLARAMPAACEAIRSCALKADLPAPELPQAAPASMLDQTLTAWAALFAKPLIVLFDEVDVLEGEAMISFLRQLRDGFATRAVGKFPVSIVLVGMRDLKDYITAAKGGVAPNPGSPFNVKEDSAVIGNFSKEDVVRLFAQRTEETGQQITQEALDYVYDQSRGQPWMVNNLFKRATMRVLTRDSTETVTLAHIQEARTQMIKARETHLDALAYRINDPRVRHVIQPLIVNDTAPVSREDPDVQYVMDLGLVSWETKSGFTIANPVYEEVLLRQLNGGYHDGLPPPQTFRWQAADGSLDMDSLLREFQAFWREHSEPWEQTANYTEAFPHLLLMAFLQRITNGGGRIDREYAAGRGRLDLLVEYAAKRYVIEIKLLRDNQTPERVREQGLAQIQTYRDTAAPEAPAYLLIFDRRSRGKKLSWGKRITWKTIPQITPSLAVLGC